MRFSALYHSFKDSKFTSTALDFFNVKLGVIALLVGILSIADNKGFLYTVDGAFLDLSYKIHNYKNPVQYKEARDITDITDSVVLLISEKMYRDEFSQHSPLNRSVLAKLIEEINKKNPENINIDLEISPFTKPTKANEQLFNSIVKSSKNTQINIVLTPIGIDKDNQAHRHNWIKSLCQQDNIQISFPTLIKSKGVASERNAISRYYPNLNTLGLKKHNSEINQCSDRYLRDLKHMPVRFIKSKDFLLGKPHTDVLDKEKINFTNLDSVAIVSLESIKDLNNLPNLENKNVFLGSDYISSNGILDRYMTPVGFLPGVAIHAFNSYTEKNPISSASGVLELGVDLILSILIALSIAYVKKINLYSAVILGVVIFSLLIFLFPIFLKHGIWVPPFIAIIGALSTIIESLINQEPNQNRKIHSNRILNLIFIIFSILSYSTLVAAFLTEFDPGEERIKYAIILFILIIVASLKEASKDKTKRVFKLFFSMIIAYFSLSYLSW